MNVSTEALDALKEVINVGVGRAAAALSELTGTRIELHVPRVFVPDTSDMPAVIEQFNLADKTTVLQPFDGELNGRAGLFFPNDSAITLAKLLSGTEVPADKLDAELSGIILETGNIVLNGVMGSIANMTSVNLSYNVPKLTRQLIESGSLGEPLSQRAEQGPHMLLADASFFVTDCDVKGSIVVVFELGCLRRLLELLGVEVAAEG